TFHRFETSLPMARDDVPDLLKQAVVAAEDKRFYEHTGIDSRGILRAFWKDLRGGDYREGASTITQQYVRLAYTGERRTISRKVREAVLAGRLERKVSKDEILYRYLSRVYFGSGAYGAAAASESYFHKPVRDLTLSEAALLAGVLPSPSTLDPRVNPAEAELRRQSVLNKMAEQGRVTPQQLAEATAQRVAFVSDRVPAGEPVTLIQPQRQQQSRYPWFTDYVRRYLIARFGAEKVYQGGLQVRTSLDPRLQAQAEAAVGEALKGTEAPLEMAMTVIDPRTGLVAAMVGGRDFDKSQVNLALANCTQPAGAPPTQPATAPVCISGGGSGRQPGSSFKPVTLAKAFESGMDDKAVYRGPGTYTIPNCSGKGCTVRNVESGGYGALTLRQATAYSVNTVYAQLVVDVGVKETAEMAHRLGLTTVNPEGVLPSGEPYGPSLTLGAAEV
ncbi:MAG: transglycosylase domain-containing protein, partial [Actinobacteria bacterium]|nr:transglycosylase domain-containing protein [Actinomycetota bacterium]